MATQTYSSSTLSPSADIGRETLLRRVLYGNVAFSVLSAGLFLFASQQVVEFLGIAGTMVFDLVDGVTFISILGVGIAIFALDVLYVATRKPLSVPQAWMIAIADFVWVALSWLLLATGAIPFSDAGNWAVLIVADIVLIFGIAEVVGIRRILR